MPFPQGWHGNFAGMAVLPAIKPRPPLLAARRPPKNPTYQVTLLLCQRAY